MQSTWELLARGFSVACSPSNLVACAVGAVLGTLVGVLPGLGPAGAIAILLPLTFGMDPVASLVMLAGIYYGSQYGGSTTSILVRVPGEAASVVTIIDGYEMARRGRAGPALAVAAIGSFVAGTMGVILLSLAAPPLAHASVRFGPPEYFAIAVLAILVLPRVTRGADPWKSYAMAALGILLGTIGMDPLVAVDRFVPAWLPELRQGISFVPVVMGLYGVAEVLRVAEEVAEGASGGELVTGVPRLSQLFPSVADLKRSIGPMLRGGLVGFILGLFPGPGNITSTWVSYGLERSISRYRNEFGKGAIEGVAGPESANNGATAGQLVPLLSLGVPFSATTALLLGAIMLHGIVPGPRLIVEHPELFWGVIASMYIGNAMLLVLNLPMVGLFARVSLVSPKVLMPLVLLFCVVGAFCVNNSVVDVWVLVLAGFLGYLLQKAGYDLAPLVLGMILSPMLEESLRQSGLLLDGRWSLLFARPISGLLLVVGLAALALPGSVRLFSVVRKRAVRLAEDMSPGCRGLHCGSARDGSGDGRSPRILGVIQSWVNTPNWWVLMVCMGSGLLFTLGGLHLGLGTMAALGAGVVPLVFGVALLVCCLGIVAEKGHVGEKFPGRHTLGLLSKMGLVVVLWVAALVPAGFVVSSLFALYACGRLFGLSRVKAGLVAIVAIAVATGLFGFWLQVPLPVGLLRW